jgi:hypothetical protein
MTNSNAKANANIENYLHAYSKLVEASPADWLIRIKNLEDLWNLLDISEKSIAYEKAGPYREMLRDKG